MNSVVTDKKSKMAVLFIGLAATSSLISQSLLDLFSILSTLLVLWIGFERKIFKSLFQKIGIEWAFLGFFTTCAIGIMWNTGGIYWDHLKPLVKLNWILNLYLMIAAFKLWLPSAEQALKVILTVSLIPSVYAIATKIANKDFLVPERPLDGRVIGMVNSATYHAHASAILFVFCAGLLASSFDLRKKTSWLYLLGLLTLGASIYITYTRGAVLAVIISVLVGFALVNWKRAAILGAAITLSAFAILKIDPLLSERVSQTVVTEKMDTGRIGLFKAHLQMFIDHPLLGMGYDIYKNSPLAIEYTKRFGVPEYLQSSHAHNQYLQILGSTGLIGFIFFLSIAVYFLWQSLRDFFNIKNKSPHYPLAMATLWTQSCILLLFLTDQSFEYAKIRYIILSSWGLSIGIKSTLFDDRRL